LVLTIQVPLKPSSFFFTVDQNLLIFINICLDYLLDSFGKIDYATLGNQAAALLEEEV
jgi:hypothetical protein